MPLAIANRYARALADVVAKTGNYEAILAEVEDFAAVWAASAELREVLETPAVSLPRKVAVVEAVAARLGLSPIALNFVRVVLEHYRLALLAEMCRAFRKIVDERRGIVRVKIYSASELSDSDKRRLRARLAEVAQRTVELDFYLDGQLLGGVRAQIGSTVYDGTLRGSLDRIRRQLVSR